MILGRVNFLRLPSRVQRSAWSSKHEHIRKHKTTRGTTHAIFQIWNVLEMFGKRAQHTKHRIHCAPYCSWYWSPMGLLSDNTKGSAYFNPWQPEFYNIESNKSHGYPTRLTATTTKVWVQSTTNAVLRTVNRRHGARSSALL